MSLLSAGKRNLLHIQKSWSPAINHMAGVYFSWTPTKPNVKPRSNSNINSSCAFKCKKSNVAKTNKNASKGKKTYVCNRKSTNKSERKHRKKINPILTTIRILQPTTKSPKFSKPKSFPIYQKRINLNHSPTGSSLRPVQHRSNSLEKIPFCPNQFTIYQENSHDSSKKSASRKSKIYDKH